MTEPKHRNLLNVAAVRREAGGLQVSVGALKLLDRHLRELVQMCYQDALKGGRRRIDGVTVRGCLNER